MDPRHGLLIALALLASPPLLAACMLPADPPWWEERRNDDTFIPGDDDDDDGDPCSPGHMVEQGCGPIGYEGCCDGHDLYWCSDGWICTLDCASNPDCGWNPDGLYYDCETDGGAAPDGVPSLECGVW